MAIRDLFNRLCEKNGVYTDGEGGLRWYRHNKLHRDDGPAIQGADGTKKWYQDGALHNENGWAVERVVGTKEKWIRGKLHCHDGPAVLYGDGREEWYDHGQHLTADEIVQKKKRLEALSRKISPNNPTKK